MTIRPITLSVLLLTSLAVGCDDVVVFDVDPEGRVLVAADAAGLAPLVADGKKPRHLFWVDPTSGAAERVTRSPLALSWPRACEGGVLFVEKRNALVLLRSGEKRTLYTSKTKKLFQPVMSDDGARVLVFEAKRLGVSGDLLVLSAKSGRVLRTLPKALLGSTWTPGGDLLVPRSDKERTEPFAAGKGEIARIGAKKARVIFSGLVPGINMLDAGEAEDDRGLLKDVLGLLHLQGEDGPIGLARFTDQKRVAHTGQVGVFDFWPAVSPDRKRLLFVRSKGDDPKLTAELRIAAAQNPANSSTVTTTGPVAAPRWVSTNRIAFITKDNHLVLQDLDGSKRIDATSALRTAYSSEESK
jgi:hypothetical protein